MFTRYIVLYFLVLDPLSYLYVMTPVLQSSVRRLVAPLQLSQKVQHLHFLVQQIDGRLHVSFTTSRPFPVDFAPVFGSFVAPFIVIKLFFILYMNEKKKKNTSTSDKDIIIHPIYISKQKQEA